MSLTFMTLILGICEFFAVFYLIHFIGTAKKECIYSVPIYLFMNLLINYPNNLGNYKQDKDTNKEGSCQIYFGDVCAWQYQKGGRFDL